MVLTVHHLNNSRSQRIIWLLEELDVPYEIKKYERHPETFLGQDDLKNLHPLARSPVLTDGDLTIAESGAIIDYIIEFYGKGRLVISASDKKNWIKYRFFLHYAEGSAIIPGVVRFYFRAMSPQEVSDKVVADFLQPELEKHLTFLEGELNKSKYFAGDELTAADIQIVFVLEFLEVLGSFKDKYPKLNEYLRGVQARPAYKRSVEKGGRYELDDFKRLYY